ncbi:hypothetical protein B0H19DRAFT_1255344 [Mycena capillaripes]|nr:hypothetical protein B0H19DRAFT_1255344 [Mycena capillaripes]
MAPWIVAETAIMLYIGESTLKKLSGSVYLPFISGCYSLSGLPPYFFLLIMPSLVLGFIMFGLTVYSCHARLEVSWSQILNVKQSWAPIAPLFLRDGIYWFAAVVAVNPVQVVMWQLAPVTLSQVLMVYVMSSSLLLMVPNPEYHSFPKSSPSIVVYSIIGSRVLLNLLDLLSAEVVGVPRYSA